MLRNAGRLARIAFAVALCGVFVAPLSALLAELSTEVVREAATAPSFPRVMGVTLGTGLLGAALSVLLGLALARPFARWRWRWQRPQRLLLLLPYLVPNFILASAYVVAWNPTTGLLNGVLPFPLGLYGAFGMTVLFAVSHLPVAFLLLEDKLRRLDPALLEQARLCGAASLTRLWRIELPLVRPTLMAAFGLCFAINISAFAIPAWIGAPERSYPLTYKVYQALQVGGVEGIPLASAYALVLFALVVPVLFVTSLAQRHERRHATVSGKASRQVEERPTRSAFAGIMALHGGVTLVGFVAPMLCLTLSTLTPPGCLQQRGLACASELTLRPYRYVLFELEETRLAFLSSGLYGGFAALLVMLIATVTLMALSRMGPFLKAAEGSFTLLTATPGAVIALGLIVSASGRFGVNLYNTPWIVVLAFVLKHQNLAFQPLRTGFANLAPALVEAARLSGAPPRRAWLSVTLPMLRGELVGGFFLVLVPILGELTMSIFLASPSFRSIGTVLFDLQDYADAAAAGALSILLLAVILIVNELARLVSRGRVGY